MDNFENQELDWSCKSLNITQHSFKNYNKLTKLDISNRAIYLIHDHAFDGLISLTELYLSTVYPR